MSFFIARTTLVWEPSIPVALVVLAIAQMGVHLVFFLHITTGPDNVNNVMALAFGVLIVLLLIAGSLWIMAQHEPQHDADGSDHADAALNHHLNHTSRRRRYAREEVRCSAITLVVSSRVFSRRHSTELLHRYRIGGGKRFCQGFAGRPTNEMAFRRHRCDLDEPVGKGAR